MKRSVSVPLLLLGSAAVLNVCSYAETDAVKQQRYASREECLQDWNDEEVCSQSISLDENNRFHSDGNWYGPRYYWDRDINRPIQLRSDGSTRVMRNARIDPNIESKIGTTLNQGSIRRGGFGSSSRGFSGGG